jgi:hypothetical protein
MGILVPLATLPSGVTLQNVYMTFTGEVLYVTKTQNGMFMVRSFYRIYKDYASRNGPSNIRVEVSVNVQNPTDNPFGVLYDQLKLQYPGATDIFEPNQTVPVTISIETLKLLAQDLSNVASQTDPVQVPLSDQMVLFAQSFKFPDEIVDGTSG